jgi:hypothetical protein
LQREPCILKEKIKILPREKNEMKLLKDWYRNTGHMFPELNLDDGYNKNKSKKWLRKKSYKYHSNEINRMFVRLRNLYPCYPNVPDDWQGWKAIEESFKPSTLRDEIRWTRICIQYCATEDEKVLEELKSWLKEMNPIQRAVMVNYFHKNEKLPNSEKLYNTIQQFKVVKKE